MKLNEICLETETRMILFQQNQLIGVFLIVQKEKEREAVDLHNNWKKD